MVDPGVDRNRLVDWANWLWLRPQECIGAQSRSIGLAHGTSERIKRSQKDRPVMSDQLSFRSLHSAQRQLLRLMQQIHFGRIERLQVRGGKPLFTPPPLVIRDHKFGLAGGPRPEVNASDFALKAVVCDLLNQLRDLGDGQIDCIHVRDGLPFTMSVQQPVAALQTV